MSHYDRDANIARLTFDGYDAQRSYRTGQLVPVVIADSHPNPPPERATRPTIEIPDPGDAV